MVIEMHIRETPRGPVLIDRDRTARIARPEAAILMELMAGETASARLLAERVWPGSVDRPPTWQQAVGVYVARLRKAGVDIVNVRGQGYALRVAA